MSLNTKFTQYLEEKHGHVHIKIQQVWIENKLTSGKT